MARVLSNMLIIRYLHVLYRCTVSHVGAVSRSYLGMMHRAVLLAFHDGLEFFKYLIIRLLNNVCIVADVKKSGYLCIAKVEEVEKQQVVRRLERFEHNGG